MKPSRRRKPKMYTIMILSDLSVGKLRQIHMPRKVLPFISVLLLLLLTAGIAAVLYIGIAYSTGNSAASELRDQVAALETENIKLTAENAELNNKVIILSDTINQKVEIEVANAEEDAKNHIPSEFPLLGKASLEEINEAAEGEVPRPTVLYEAAEGTAVIATGDAKVIYAGQDEIYGYCVILDHENGYKSIYRLAAEPKVKLEDEITRGTILYEMSGADSKLAYQVTYNDEYVNPLDIMEISG